MARGQMDLYGDLAKQILKTLREDLIKDECVSLLLKHVNDKISKKVQLPFNPSIWKGSEWLNTEREISLEVDCGQRLYILHFFTFCCMHCFNILPYLDNIEKKYGNKVSVIGVHLQKLANEKYLVRQEEAFRNNIRYPVLNDSDGSLWNAIGFSEYPTVFLVGPGNNLQFILVGENQIKHLDVLCELVLDAYHKHGINVDESPLPICQAETKETEKFTDLLYPGNISTNGKDLMVSDTGHHRLILMSYFLEKKDIIGSGIPGCVDGSFETSSFKSPHGTTWYNGDVYVADTGNHCIRKVSFTDRSVTTVHKGCLIDFRLPWDICLGPYFGPIKYNKKKCDNLYIAVAGANQIWNLDLNKHRNESKKCYRFAGTGRNQNVVSTDRLKAAFTKPSGITYDQTMEPSEMYIADTENSTIKCLSLENGSVTKICGEDQTQTDLVQFIRDGKQSDARLQHPMGICVLMKNNLIIADTNNNKIKIVDLRKRTCKTIPIELEVSLNKPSSVCTLLGSLFIADTNNNRIVKIPIKELLPSIFEDLPGMKIYTENILYKHEVLPKTIISLKKWGTIFCHFSFSSDEIPTYNKLALQKLDLSFSNDKEVDVLWKDDIFFGEPNYTMVLQAHGEITKVTLSLTIGFSDKDTCTYEKVYFHFFVQTSDKFRSNSVHLMLRLTEKCKLEALYE